MVTSTQHDASMMRLSLLNCIPSDSHQAPTWNIKPHISPTLSQKLQPQQLQNCNSNTVAHLTGKTKTAKSTQCLPTSPSATAIASPPTWVTVTIRRNECICMQKQNKHQQHCNSIMAESKNTNTIKATVPAA